MVHSLSLFRLHKYIQPSFYEMMSSTDLMKLYFASKTSDLKKSVVAREIMLLTLFKRKDQDSIRCQRKMAPLLLSSLLHSDSSDQFITEDCFISQIKKKLNIAMQSYFSTFQHKLEMFYFIETISKTPRALNEKNLDVFMDKNFKTIHDLVLYGAVNKPVMPVWYLSIDEILLKLDDCENPKMCEQALRSAVNKASLMTDENKTHVLDSIKNWFSDPVEASKNQPWYFYCAIRENFSAFALCLNAQQREDMYQWADALLKKYVKLVLLEKCEYIHKNFYGVAVYVLTAVLPFLKANEARNQELFNLILPMFTSSSCFNLLKDSDLGVRELACMQVLASGLSCDTLQNEMLVAKTLRISKGDDYMESHDYSGCADEDSCGNRAIKALNFLCQLIGQGVVIHDADNDFLKSYAEVLGQPPLLDCVARVTL